MSLDKKKLEDSIPAVDAEISKLNIRNATLPAYDQSKISLEFELADVKQKINDIISALEASKDLQIKIANNENMISLKNGELARNENTKAHNSARNKYVGILNELYELLATSQFPRKLIQTYSSTVSEYLSENLRNFNFPYRAEVNDNFGIDVFDDQNRKLPSVSGGQEIMIGVALRLALHSMFGEAFPMLIFDEGSVHLSQESKKHYFEVIKNMNDMSKLKQIIIIDHDEDLTDVVDNTIKL
jgi:DNA repair exonuclease SbcCD ATPase subunit